MHLNNDTYKQLTEAVSVKDLDLKYGISKQVFTPFYDYEEDQETRFYRGDMHLSDLTMINDSFNIVIDGDLIVDGCLNAGSGISGNFIFVTGNVQATSVVVSDVCTLAIGGNLTALYGIVGYAGEDGGSIDVNGQVKSPFIICKSDFNMSFATMPDVLVVYISYGHIYIKQGGICLESSDVNRFLPDMLHNGIPNVFAIITTITEGRPALTNYRT